MPKFLKILITLGILILMIGAINLWYNTVILGGLYYNAFVKAGICTLILLTCGYAAYSLIRHLFKK